MVKFRDLLNQYHFIGGMGTRCHGGRIPWPLVKTNGHKNGVYFASLRTVIIKQQKLGQTPEGY
jgi:hypothetical protein